MPRRLRLGVTELIRLYRVAREVRQCDPSSRGNAMVPIYEQGNGRGIGHGLDSFLTRFETICWEHRNGRRAQSFALIFYDFGDAAFRTILRDQGVFAQLDRLSGKKLSIFYLHCASRSGVRRFNEAFTSALGLNEEVRLPCVAFFKLSDNGFTDVAIAAIDSADKIHGFHELYDIVERYLQEEEPEPEGGLRFIRWIKSATAFVSIEVVRGSIRALLGHFPF